MAEIYKSECVKVSGAHQIQITTAEVSTKESNEPDS